MASGNKENICNLANNNTSNNNGRNKYYNKM